MNPKKKDHNGGRTDGRRMESAQRIWLCTSSTVSSSSPHAQVLDALLHVFDSVARRGRTPLPFMPFRLELAVPNLAHPPLFSFFVRVPRCRRRVEVRVLLGRVEAGAAATVFVGRFRIGERRRARCTRSVSGLRETTRSNDGIDTLLPLASRSPAGLGIKKKRQVSPRVAGREAASKDRRTSSP